MRKIAEEVEAIVGKYASRIEQLSEEAFSKKPSPTVWSKKEILGHLVDSAQNNIQRFVRGQYEDSPRIVYSQNEWVHLQRYQDYSKKDLLALWVALNRHLCWILSGMNPGNETMQCDTGKSGIELHTLQYFAEDYKKHLLHHLEQLEQRN